MSNKKEIKIGDTVQILGDNYVCKEQTNIEICRDCDLYCLNDVNRNFNRCLRYIGQCIGDGRTDKKDVIFKLKRNEK